jgi:hypothetical protein
VWLNPAVGLYEQDVTPEMTLIFDKAYFYSDDIVDLSDPMQLHLIYSKVLLLSEFRLNFRLLLPS